jgi:hypothetical protein
MKRYTEGDFIILVLCVDGMLIVGNGTNRIALLAKAFSKSFAMKNLGPCKKIPGMKISHDRSKKLLWLSEKNELIRYLKGSICKAQSMLSLHLQTIKY